MTRTTPGGHRLQACSIDAVIFDLDGVVTDTASVHAAAWKMLFDEYLQRRAIARGEPFRPFDSDADYRRYVDGKPRYEGVRSFLQSRGIELADGDPGDDPGQETVCGLGNRKNQAFQQRIGDGVEVYDSTVRLIRDLRRNGVRTAIVSSSKNCRAVLEAAGIAGLFDARVDGTDLPLRGLKGKPDPDIFLTAARDLGAAPERSIVVEDAISGVQAGRRGGFGCVIGIDRAGDPEALRSNGADLVVSDMSEVSLMPCEAQHPNGEIPSALERFDELSRRLEGRRPAIILDGDGTLIPIVPRPELAELAGEMRAKVRALARRCFVAVVSGRDLPDVRRLVGVEEIYYAGANGFDACGPLGRQIESPVGTGPLPRMDAAERDLRERLAGIQGCLIERKGLSVAIHYGLVAGGEAAAVEQIVDQVRAAHPGLRKTPGKEVLELRPDADWNRGRAVRHLLEVSGMTGPGVVPVYFGDDATDEDAFDALAKDGIGVVVMDPPRPSAAHFRLRDPGEVGQLFDRLDARLADHAHE